MSVRPQPELGRRDLHVSSAVGAWRRDADTTPMPSSRQDFVKSTLR